MRYKSDLANLNPFTSLEIHMNIENLDNQD